MLHQASVHAAGGTKIRISVNDKIFDYEQPAGMDRVNIGVEALSVTTEIKPDGSRIVEEAVDPTKTDAKTDGKQEVSHSTLSPEGQRVHMAATDGLKDAKDSKPAPTSTGGGTVSATGKSASKTSEPRGARSHA